MCQGRIKSLFDLRFKRKNHFQNNVLLKGVPEPQRL